MQSKYSQRMVRLSCKIFGEYRRPPLPQEIQKERCIDPKPRDAWHSFHYRNENTINKHSIMPLDLDNQRNPNYYPPHPQHIKLISTLRDYGLFRFSFLSTFSPLFSLLFCPLFCSIY